MNQKILLVVIAVLPACLSKTTKEIFAELKRRAEEHPECIELTGVTQEEVDAHFLRLEMSPTASFKCFLHCEYKTYNLIKKDGSLNRDEFLKVVERATTEMMESCDARIVEVKDQCEKTFKLSECITHYGHTYV